MLLKIFSIALEGDTFSLQRAWRMEAVCSAQKHVATGSLLAQSEEQSELTVRVQLDAPTPVNDDFDADFSSSAQRRQLLRWEPVGSARNRLNRNLQ